MNSILAAALAAAAASPAFAQDTHEGHAHHADHAAAPASTARLNLDTPVEAIVADPAGKAVLEGLLPGVEAHEHYPMFKTMGLRQIAGYAPDVFTPELLAKLESGLAGVK
jgi:hypothetical protein